MQRRTQEHIYDPAATELRSATREQPAARISFRPLGELDQAPVSENCRLRMPVSSAAAV